MKRFRILGVCVSLAGLMALTPAAMAQKWEFGGAGGGGFLSNVDVTGGAGSATAGFSTGAAFSGYVGFSQYKHIGGEIRYAYLPSNLSLKSGGTEATFSGVSHVVHYDLIFKTTRNSGKVQLFAAAGGGVKVFRGTGKEASYQALEQYGLFTKTQTLKPMLSVGGGVKFALSKKVFLRTEFRDYITQFPTEVITPPSGSVKYGKILHDFVPMVGLGFEM